VGKIIAETEQEREDKLWMEIINLISDHGLSYAEIRGAAIEALAIWTSLPLKARLPQQ